MSDSLLHTIRQGSLFVGRTRLDTQKLTASGVIRKRTGSIISLAHNSTPIAATLAAPAPGDWLLIANDSASGTAAHTVTLPDGVTWDGTNKVATLDAPGEALLVFALSATRFLVVVNIGSVAFS